VVAARHAGRRNVRALVIVALLGLGLAACSAGGPGSGRPQVSVQPAVRAGQPPVPPGRLPTRGPQGLDPTVASGVQLDVLSGLRGDTPIYNGDFADPFVLRTPNSLVVYASNSVATQYAPAAHIPEIDLTRDSGFQGQYVGDALPQLPKWTVSGYQWAPSVWLNPDGTYVMYYSTPATIPLICLANASSPGCIHSTNGPTSAMCISRATSASPTGPFVDDSSSAFVCPYGQGGAIDPSVFAAPDGSHWLLWKSDGDCCGLPTSIYSQQLSADGLSVVGPAHLLIGASQQWEGGLVEGPSMLEAGGTFWLFYSANLWGTANYGIGVARCASVIGPCTKPLDHAWLSATSGGGQSDPGPGGEEFFPAGGFVWMVHHGLAPGESGNFAQRRLYVDLVAVPAGGVPRIASGDVAAALAEAVLYFGDPDLPASPKSAYLTLLHKVPGAFSGVSDADVIAEGELSCRELARHDSAAQIELALGRQSLNGFESDLVAEFAAQYFCPDDTLQALSDLRQALGGSP
jgi:Glycosyl hydrolases family 43